jgi:glycerophosphoryl diester phosphodiesterase
VDLDWLTSTPIAHRGLHRQPDVPENSLAAFDAAGVRGYAIELDVRLLADGALAVLHDGDTRRMTGIAGKLAALDRESLRGYRLGGTAFAIPLLGEVLDLIAGRVPVLIEIKTEGRAGAIEPAVAALLDGYRGAFAVQSFNPYAMDWFRRHRPHFPRGLLSGRLDDRPDLGWLRKTLMRNLLLFPLIRPHFIAYEFEALDPVRRHLFKTLFRVPILVWTVRSMEDWNAARRAGANAIFEGFEAGVVRR